MTKEINIVEGSVSARNPVQFEVQIDGSSLIRASQSYRLGETKISPVAFNFSSFSGDMEDAKAFLAALQLAVTEAESRMEA